MPMFHSENTFELKDLKGRKLEVGDRVVSTPKTYGNLELGTVVGFHRNNHTVYMKPYNPIKADTQYHRAVYVCPQNMFCINGNEPQFKGMPPDVIVSMSYANKRKRLYEQGY